MAYRKTVLPPRILVILMWLLFLGCLALVVVLWALKHDEPLPASIATVVLLVTSGPMVLIRGVITVDEQALRLTMVPMFRKTIPLAEITSVELSRVDPWQDFGGWGYRLLGDGMVGFVFVKGPAARVHTTGGRTYVISDPDAEELAAVLRAHRPGILPRSS